MKILHIIPGLNEVGNGIAVAAKLIADGQRRAGHEVDLVDVDEFIKADHPFLTFTSDLDLTSANAEVWVHSMWLPAIMKACRLVLKAGIPLVRMTHANLDPLRLHSKGWKKLPVWYLVERSLMNRSARVVATCEAEADWNRRAGVTSPIDVMDLKVYFSFPESQDWAKPVNRPLHVLYLGRPHPLKGVKYLEWAVDELNRTNVSDTSVQLRIVSDHRGEELERDWAWADVLCLPTLSENFGLVVAEALQRGLPVVTTDGAPVWDGQVGVVYVKGYRDGDDAARVRLLKGALGG